MLFPLSLSSLARSYDAYCCPFRAIYLALNQVITVIKEGKLALKIPTSTPKSCAELVEDCLEYDVNERASASQLAKRIRRLQEGMSESNASAPPYYAGGPGGGPYVTTDDLGYADMS